MARTKTASQVASKWGRVTPQRAEDYSIGVQNPRVPWAAATKAAEERYKEGVNAAMQRGAFGKGVAAAGDAKWSAKSMAKGPTRFSEGVALSTPDYEAGVGKYLDVINNTTLPPRYAKGDPRNLKRVEVLATALRKAKTG